VVGRSGEGLGRRNAQRRTERPLSHTWRASGATSSGSHCGTSRTARCAASGRLGAYAENLTRAITAKLEQLDLNVPINVTIGLAPPGADLRYGTTPLPGENYSRINDAIAAAIAATPGPATLPGTPLKRAEILDVLPVGAGKATRPHDPCRCRLVILLHGPPPGLAGHVVVFSPRRKRSGA